MTSTRTALALPAMPAPPARSPLPLFASLVPVIGGVAMWLVTGSVLALWFAALGPLIAVAALIDQARGSRRRGRRVAGERVAVLDALEADVAELCARAVDALRSAHPDVATLVADPSEVWRGGSELVVGSGERPSGIAVTGTVGDDERASGIVERATRLVDAPVTVAWRGGVCVAGDGVESVAVLRSLLLQLCLRHPPTDVRIVGDPPPGWEWLEQLPHRASRHPDAVRVAVRAGDPVSADADVVFALSTAGRPPEPRCATIVTLEPEGRVRIARTAALDGGDEAAFVEAVSAAQAELVSGVLAVRSRAVYAGAARVGEILDPSQLQDAPGIGASGGLAVAFGWGARGPVMVDLVADGPHAVVIGVTGSGKSELLTTWISALCATYSTSDVSFLLADFKGGTAFEALADLPHVTGVITDLDAAGAARAISSLRAELRRRESALASVGARDIVECTLDLPRLVIVVDEYAALVTEHAELAAVFADVAARGRALGMHLVIGTQRATGVIRDAVLGNCPLRIALRVTDAADSRLVLGTDAAARLSGAVEERGRALVRRTGDDEAVALRVVRTGRDHLDAIARQRSAEMTPRRPWLPPLPHVVPLDELRSQRERPGLVLGLVDDPGAQRRALWTFDPARDRALLAVGGTGSGRTTLLRAAAAQSGEALWIARDPEAGWDAIESLVRGRMGGLVLADDLDALFAALPDEYALAAVGRLESVLRDGDVALIASARRISGPLARIADLFPRRAVLAHPTRAEFVAAGGEGVQYSADLPPGRVLVDGLWAQIPHPGDSGPPAGAGAPDEWRMPAVAAVVSRATTRLSDALVAQGLRVVSLAELPPGARDWRSLDLGGSERVVAVGDPESWQQRWALLAEARDRHEILLDAACAAELRMITGERELPPYCRPRAGRAWLVRGGEPVRRVLVPELVPRW